MDRRRGHLVIAGYMLSTLESCNDRPLLSRRIAAAAIFPVLELNILPGDNLQTSWAHPKRVRQGFIYPKSHPLYLSGGQNG